MPHQSTSCDPVPQHSHVADVLIIGGSHAGLSAALTLYRALHTCIIFDSSNPRTRSPVDSSALGSIHLTPTWEHASPDEMKHASRKELSQFGREFVSFVDDVVIRSIRKRADGLFEASSSPSSENSGEEKIWAGRKVLLALGAQDMFPDDLPGYCELYASGIYPCLFQYGFELRGSISAGVLAVDSLASAPHAMIMAQDGRKYAKEVTIYTNGNHTLAQQLAGLLPPSAAIKLDAREVSRLSRAHDNENVALDFADGSRGEEAFLIHRPRTRIDITLAEQLGVGLSKMGDMVEVMPPFCKTNVGGVYAAGDCASMMKTINNAINTGAYAGCGIARELGTWS